MRKLTTFLGIIVLLICLVSCDKPKQDIEWDWSMKTSYRIQEDGWVYFFSYTYYKDGSEEYLPYNFKGINLRYRYNDEYTQTISYMEDGERKYKTVPQTIQILGMSDNDSVESDMMKIADILKYQGGVADNEALLNLTEEQLAFKEVDGKMFIELIQCALNSEAHREGNYADLPEYALLTEPDYISDCKFQIGFITTMGCVDVMFIDVLYRTGSEYNSYIQLSDIIASGDATEEQKELYKTINEISQGIVEDNDMQFGLNTYKNKTIDNVKLSRLYIFLSDIEEVQLGRYIINPKDL